MSDTAHPELPSQVGIPRGSEPPAVPNAEPPSPTNGQSELGEFPEEILNEWRWIFKGREEGVFDLYAGRHVAVYQQKIWGNSLDAELLREHVALKYQIDPERLVIAYIDRW